MLRNNCVVCDGSQFTDIYKKTKYPIVFTPPSKDKNVEHDEYEELHFIGCKNCGCVQTKVLIDQVKLYKDAYNITYNYPTMQRHHDGFADFIIKSIINDKIIEIGGSNGALVKIIQGKKRFDYSILDLCDRAPDVPEVKFINANCETHDFTENNTVILSHVFEHLYNPLKFVENLKRNNINQVIISNPDFDILLERNDISFINFEHTYYCNTSHLDHIMKQYGYSRKDSLHFEKWAVFYNYVKDIDETVYYDNDLTKNLYLLERLVEYFTKRENTITKIRIDNNYKTFICTAGNYGQMVYTFLDENTKPSIVGFLDGDPFKIGKRVYGTEHFTYAKSKLSEYVNVNVILCVERYRDEITAELLSHNKNTNIINI
jgi:hypothetical protein